MVFYDHTGREGSSPNEVHYLPIATLLKGEVGRQFFSSFCNYLRFGCLKLLYYMEGTNRIGQ